MSGRKAGFRRAPRLARSITVSISGSDGSGKTSTCRELGLILEALGVKSDYRWQRPGSSPFLEAGTRVMSLGRAERKSFARREPESGSGDARSRTGSRLLNKAIVVVVGTDYLVRTWAQMLRARFTRGVHIFDRFLLDAAVDIALWYGTGLPSWILRLGPKPDRSVLLEVSPEIAASRSTTPAYRPEAGSEAYRNYVHVFDLVVRDADSSRAAAEEIAGEVLGAFAR